MILDSLQRHAAIITDYEVLKFNLVGDSYQLICQVDLSDGSTLHVRDYLISGWCAQIFISLANSYG